MCEAYDDLNHFASIQFHFVAWLHVYMDESFLVEQYNPLVRFDLACRSDARQLATPAVTKLWCKLTMERKGCVPKLRLFSLA